MPSSEKTWSEPLIENKTESVNIFDKLAFMLAESQSASSYHTQHADETSDYDSDDDILAVRRGGRAVNDWDRRSLSPTVSDRARTRGLRSGPQRSHITSSKCVVSRLW